jgi:hypothetical protein
VVPVVDELPASEEEAEVDEVVVEEEDEASDEDTGPEVPPISPSGGVCGVPLKASAPD